MWPLFMNYSKDMNGTLFDSAYIKWKSSIQSAEGLVSRKQPFLIKVKLVYSCGRHISYYDTAVKLNTRMVFKKWQWILLHSQYIL